MHACFKLGGAFGVETLTAEGVEAMDALPVLHLSLGAVPKDAVVDPAGKKSMRCFYRVNRPVVAVVAAPCLEHAVGQKRPSSAQLVPALGDVSRKKMKPVLRASKQQDLGNLLLGFST